MLGRRGDKLKAERSSGDSESVASPLESYDISAAVLSDVGCQREINEDCGRYVRPGANGEFAAKGVVAVVADGMGGHSAGEVASRLAVDVICRAYFDEQSDVVKSLERAVREANGAVYDESQRREQCAGMGTTCTALALRGGVAVSAQIGDSRLYLVRGGEIYLMTEDQTAVMELRKAGALSSEEARCHPDKNVILRALGTRPDIEIAMWETPLPVRLGDSFVICSDGLHDLVADSEMRNFVEAGDPLSACESLIGLARARGGHDNITVAVVAVTPVATSQRSVRPTRDLKLQVNS